MVHCVLKPHVECLSKMHTGSDAPNGPLAKYVIQRVTSSKFPSRMTANGGSHLRHGHAHDRLDLADTCRGLAKTPETLLITRLIDLD